MTRDEQYTEAIALLKEIFDWTSYKGTSWAKRAEAVLIQAGQLPPACEPAAARCPDGLLPDGEVCPRCGGPRAASGIDGGTWVHFNTTGTASA